MQLLLKLVRRGDKPVFVSNRQEFLSLWFIAHTWEGLQPASTDSDSIPESIQGHLDMLLLAFLRNELTLRRSDGYRVVGHTFLQTLFGMDKDLYLISDQLYRKKPLDKAFLDDLYVKRSDLLRWCEEEFREPPACWAPQPAKTNDSLANEDLDDNEPGPWLDQLTGLRRRKVAFLEIAKHLWQKDRFRSYEDVYNDLIFDQAGLRTAFSQKSFKKWARNFAPEEAKHGGRPSKSAA